MKKLHKQKLFHSAVLFTLFINAVYSGYIESDPFAFSFYIPGKYEKKTIENNYGPFVLLSHPEGIMFVHFWARKRPQGSDISFLKEAYRLDFYNKFIAKETHPPEILKSEKNLQYSVSSVILLEQHYENRVYYTRNGNFFYVLSIFIQEGKQGQVKEDVDMIMNSLSYGVR